MDVLYTVKQADVDEELIYSLRSLANLPHDKVFLVGGLPRNINPSSVIHIPTDQTGTKYKNTTHAWQVAINDPRLSEDFIVMNDDFFILNPVKDLSELDLNMGQMEDVINRFRAKHFKLTNYFKGMEDTLKYIRSTLGIEHPLSYELHIPFVVNKTNIKKMFELPNVFDMPVLHKRSLYGALYKTGGTTVHDCKVLVNTAAERVNELLKGSFLSTSDRGWPRVEGFVKRKFNFYSPYELTHGH